MPKQIMMIPPINPMSFCALSEANKELTPNHAMNTMEISDRETPMARWAPLRNPFVMLVWMREKKAGPTIKESVRPNSIPCVMILKLTIWKPPHNKTVAKVAIKRLFATSFYRNSSIQGMKIQWQEPYLYRLERNGSLSLLVKGIMVLWDIEWSNDGFYL